MRKFVTLLIYLFFILTFIGCSKNISPNNDSDDNFKLQMENENFKFYSFNQDKDCLDDLAKVLKDNYSRISKDLNINLKDKIIIEIYPDINSYHNSIGSPNAPDWVVGTGWGNKIKMVSPLNPGKQHTYETLKQVVVHEFTHVAISSINSNLDSIPLWLNEGTAVYEAKQMSDNTRVAIKEKVNNNEIPSLSKMSPENFSATGGYAFSYTAIEYIVKNYGYDTLISLLKTPTNLEKIIGTNMIEFEGNWRSYLKENYK